MNIYIEKLTDYNLDIFTTLAQWDNDPEIKAFITPRQSEKEIEDISPEKLLENARKNTNKCLYIVYDNEKPIGTYSITSNFSALMHKNNKTAWISILIGDKNYWGKGISKIMMEHIEEQCRKMKFEFIELGVFEFNQRARNLYHSMGYQEIGKNNNFVYHKGSWYDDIRMLKKL